MVGSSTRLIARSANPSVCRSHDPVGSNDARPMCVLSAGSDCRLEFFVVDIAMATEVGELPGGISLGTLHSWLSPEGLEPPQHWYRFFSGMTCSESTVEMECRHTREASNQ